MAMTANIITLGSVRRSKVRCVENKVTFPVLFRMTAFYWNLDDDSCMKDALLTDDAKLSPDTDRPSGPIYTLDKSTAAEFYALPTWIEITCLDPDIDDGTVIVRHHASEEALEAYTDAIWDTDAYDEKIEERFQAFKTSLGIFTVLHRRSKPGGVNCALVFTTRLKHPSHGYVPWRL